MKKESLIENTAHLLARISFRQIRCFIAVAQNGSFMAAANVLGITQPAVSRSIREIESILNVSLFDRSLRGAVLTPHGRKLFDAAEAGIALMAEGVRATQDISGSRELLRIGALPNVCGLVLPAIIEDFQHVYPHTTIRIVSGANADLLARLRQGGLDLVIGRLSDTVSMKGLTFQHLYDEEIVFAMGAQHVLAQPGANVELRTVLEMPMLAPIPGTVIRQELERFLFRSGVVAPNFALESIDAGFINKIIRASNHVVVTVEALVTEARTSGDVVVLPIRDDALRGPVGLTMLPDTQPGPALRMLMQMFRENLPSASQHTKNDMKMMDKE
ncbi:LysR substrate-binding domain-containing protein [Halomonas sp. PAMB 3232]|uniref:LysR substrate-binding domain-containing protein n=1 Tax=Halomonas sp. PAMB 3232 TaxID=3075221 RepID=UPI002899FB9C|nr:LysR substrate-binding domain-containing protein [Halomonas sp. PAMB 3232]WNL39058.1 LysR substrate-binding domain-containing protein [Halomonas sp. PAMB 3232]